MEPNDALIRQQNLHYANYLDQVDIIKLIDMINQFKEKHFNKEVKDIFLLISDVLEGTDKSYSILQRYVEYPEGTPFFRIRTDVKLTGALPPEGMKKIVMLGGLQLVSLEKVD